MLFESDQTIPFTQWVVRPSQKTFLSSSTESMFQQLFLLRNDFELDYLSHGCFCFQSENTRKYNDQWEIPEYFPSRPRSPSHDPSNQLLFQLFGKITLKTWVNQRLLMLLTLKEKYTSVSLSFCISTTELCLIEV